MRNSQLIAIFVISGFLIFANNNCSDFDSTHATSDFASSNLPFGNAQVSLSWDANSESDIAGYRIYYGLSANQLVARIDVGLTNTPISPSANVLSLVDKSIYFFSVKAYNTAGLESGFSNAVSSLAK